MVHTISILYLLLAFSLNLAANFSKFLEKLNCSTLKAITSLTLKIRCGHLASARNSLRTAKKHYRIDVRCIDLDRPDRYSKEAVMYDF